MITTKEKIISLIILGIIYHDLLLVMIKQSYGIIIPTIIMLWNTFTTVITISDKITTERKWY